MSQNKELDITAVLFSGGKGSRLFPINEFYQKVMMPIGSYGTPMLEIVIRHLKYHGITKFLALIGYKGNQIKHYFGTGERFDVEIKYSFDNQNLKGTGGALYNAKNLIETDNFMIYYTDILTSLNFTDFFKYHFRNKKLATIWLDPHWEEIEHSIKFDDHGMALSLSKQTEEKNIYVNTGISCLNKGIFEILQNINNLKKTEKNIEIDLSKDLFPILADNNQIQGYISDEWWLDIGTLQRHSSLTSSLLLSQLGHLKGDIEF